MKRSILDLDLWSGVCSFCYSSSHQISPHCVAISYLGYRFFLKINAIRAVNKFESREK